jgi:ABC-type uncharacterized transport system permease subunit
MRQYSRIPLIQLLIISTPDSLALEENIPKTRSFTVGSVQYAYWFRDCIWPLLSPSVYIRVSKDPEMSKQDTAGKKKHVT